MEDDPDPCFICGGRYEDARKLPDETWSYSCNRCGSYCCENIDVAVAMEKLSLKDRPRISGWIRNKNRLGHFPTISLEQLDVLKAKQIPSADMKAIYYLKEALASTGGIGRPFNYMEPRYLGATYSQEPDDLHPLIEHLRKSGFINNVTLDGPNAMAMITVQGEKVAREAAD